MIRHIFCLSVHFPQSRREVKNLPDRTGAGVLYSSDEEDRFPPKSSNPFEPFTVNSLSPSPDSRLPRETGSRDQTSPVSHRKGVFNPLGQVEIPALLSTEGDSEETMHTLHNPPVIDGWLVDDMPHAPPPKRTRRKSGSEIDDSAAFQLQPTSGRRKGSQLRLNKTQSKQKVGARAQGVKETHAHRQDVIHIEDELFNDDLMFDDNFGASVSTQQPMPSEQVYQFPSSAAAITQSSISHRIEHAQHSTSAPLRVKVRINSKSLLIPCPR